MAKIDFKTLDGQVLSGPQGAKLKVESIEFKEFINPKTNELQEGIVLTGTATDVLANPYNPGQGSNPLPDAEVVPWEFMYSIGGDGQKKVAELNAAFMFDPPLVDGSETALRFFDEDEASVADHIRNTGLYVRVSAKPKPDAPPDKPVPVYFNLVAMQKRTSTADKGLHAKLKAKLAAKMELSTPF